LNANSRLEPIIALLPLLLVLSALILAWALYSGATANDVPLELDLGHEQVTSNVSVLGYIGTSDTSGFPGQLALYVIGIYPGFHLASGADSACVDTLQAHYTIAQSGGFALEDWEGLDIDEVKTGPICTDWDPTADTSLRISNPLKWTIPLSAGLQSIGYFTYPFDTIDISVDFQLDGTRYDSEGTSVGTFELPVEQLFGVATQGLVVNRASMNRGNGIVLERPLLVRLMAPLLALFLLLPIVFIPRVNAPETAVELAIASLVGVWGVRQTLLPGVAPGMTLLDRLLLAENAAAALALIVYFALRARRLRQATIERGGDAPGTCPGEQDSIAPRGE
jgi:hypothetical protein